MIKKFAIHFIYIWAAKKYKKYQYSQEYVQ